MRDMRDALIWDGVGRALSRGSWDYWRTGTVGDTGTGHRRGAKRGHRVLQGCWKRSIGPDVELAMLGVKTGSWVGNWEMASVGPHRGRNRYRDSILVGGSMRDDWRTEERPRSGSEELQQCSRWQAGG